MLWVPQKGKLRVQHNTGAVATTADGTTVTTGASDSAKGSAAEIFSSTDFDSYLMTVVAFGYGTNAAASSGCLDILIGAATEEVLIPNLLMGSCGLIGGGNAYAPKVWMFPLYTPAGSRIAARAAGLRHSTDLYVQVWLAGGDAIPPFRVGTKVTTYGVSSVPAGVSITPGASGSEGAWAEITSSTSEDHFAFVPSFQAGNDAVWSARAFTVDIGVGAATERQIAEGYRFAADTGETIGGPVNPFPCFQDVPAGTRLAMRASNTSTNIDPYEVALHAVS